MRILLLTVFTLLSLGSNYANEGLVQTINYQGFIQSQETGAPLNNTFSMHFYIHPEGDLPPFDTSDENIWYEFYEKISVKDGVFFQRLGVYNPLTKGLFRTDTPKELTIKIVPFGTNEQASYLGPMSIDGNPYSVSSVAKKGPDLKEGTLKIIPFRGTGTPNNVNALLEIYSPDTLDEVFHNVEINWTKSEVAEANIGKGLIIDYPNDLNVIDYVPSSTSSETPWGEPLISPNENVEDIAVYIENGNIKLGGSLTIKPYTIGAYTVPGDLYAAAANVTGNIRVNDLITEGTIRGPKLEYCDPQFENCIPDGSKYADYLIDPYPTEQVEYKPTLINALEIGSKNIEFDGSVEEDSKGEFTLEGPLTSSEPAYIKLSGSDSLVYTPKLISPYPSIDTQVKYQISPGGLSVLDSLILYTRTDISRDPNNPEYTENITSNNALKSPLNAYSLFELLSTAPVCGPQHGKDKYYMALRENYCNAKEGTRSDDKYYEIDPCQGISNSELEGYDLACADTLFSDHPNFITREDNPSEGQKFFAGNHVHNVLEEATAKMLIDIINASSLRVDKKLLPTDAVNKTIVNTLTGVNVFQEIRAADKVVAAKAKGLEVDAYIGTSHLSKEFPAQIGSLNSDVDSIEFLHESTNTEVGLDVAAGNSTFNKKIEIGKHLSSWGDLNIEKNPSGLAGGNLRFDRKAGGRPPYFYLPGETVVSGDISFPTTVGINQRIMSGMSALQAERFIDLDDQSYVIHPGDKSVLEDLTVTGEIIIDRKMNVEGSADFTHIVSAQTSLLANVKAKANKFSDLDNPNYIVEPTNTSVLRKLKVANDLIVSGSFTLKSDLTISDLLTVNNFETEQNLIVEDPNASVKSLKILDFNTESDYLIDPSEITKLHSLELKDDGSNSGGNLSIDGDLVLTQAINHVGSANIQGYVTAVEFIHARKLVDQDNNSYVLDPNNESILEIAHIADSYENTSKTTVNDELLVSQDVSSNSSLVLNGDMNVEDNLNWKNSFSLVNSGIETFSVDDEGNMTAVSIILDSDLFIEDLETLGSLSVEGGDITFNADTSMDKFTIITSSLISMHPSTYQTVFRVEPKGNVTVQNNVNFKGKIRFAHAIDITTDSASLLSITDSKNSITTVNIGITGQKNLKIAGLSADRLKFTTGYFKTYRDLNAQSSRYIDPSSQSIIETLEIESSLYAENSLTAPFAVDLENQYVVNPNQDTRLQSLEVLKNATAEQIRLSKLIIDTQNQSPGTRILDADSLIVNKSQDITFVGSSYFRKSIIHVNQNSGLRISAISTGEGHLMTPGDLDSLINKKNADYLHHHNLFGGVEIYNLARRDINNSIPDSVNTTATTKALHGQYLFTSDGLILSVRPDQNSGTKPLFSVYSYDGSLKMGALSSGTVIAQTFKGSGAEVSNIAGSATSYSAILSETIDSIKIQDNSLVENIFSDDIIANENILDGTINSSHIQANTFDGSSIANEEILGIDLSDKSILNRHIKVGQIDGTLLQNESIKSYHLTTNQISVAKVQSKTLTARVFANQAFTTDKIADQSLITTHISKGAVDSNKIIIDSLIDTNFDDLSISTIKIKQDTVQNSELAQLTLTNSDFGSDSITSVKILDLTIIESNISTNTLSGTALVDNSVDFSKLVSFTIKAEDIENSTITSSSDSAQHKISNEAITSEKIEDRNITGAKIANNVLMSSHIPSDTVTDLQFALSSIAHEDIKTATLSGLKIQNLSITARMFEDEALLANNIDDNTFKSNSVAENTLSSKSFADAAITKDKISNNTVSSTNIIDLSLLDADFGSDSLVETKWLTDTISTVKIGNQAITLEKFSNAAILSLKVSDHAISTAAIKPANILTEHWVLDAVIESKFANSAVTEGHIIDSQIDARVAAPNSILSSNIKNLSVNSNHIPDEEITASKIADDAVTASMIKDSQINEGKFGLLSIISSNFKQGSVTNIHIDLNTLSSRVIAEKQVLTTHINDEAITNSRIKDSQIDSRVIFNSAIIHSLIESYALQTSDFALGILTDSQFASKVITAGKIKDDSIAENLWVSADLFSYHVDPYTITSASLDDQIITSAKIASQTISGSHIEDGSITDLDLAADAMVTAVFDSEVITSGLIKNNSLLAQDFGALSLLTTHYDSRIFENSHFTNNSILTTHIIDFTLESSVFASDSITAGKIDNRSSLSRGFKAVSKSPNLSNPSQILELNSGKILVFDNTHGIYRLDSANSPILSKVSSLTGSFGKAMTYKKRVWVMIGSKLYSSSYEGLGMREMTDFGSDIQDFYFEDEFHGFLTTDSKAYYSYDGGESFRLVKTGSSFRKVFSISDLQHSWLIKSNGQTLYTTDEYLNESVLALAVNAQIDSNFSFWMHSPTEGLFLDDDTLVNTSDNWSNDASNTQLNTPFFFSDSSGNNIFITTAGLSRYTLWTNLSGSTDTSFSEYSSPSLVAEAAHISETDTWVILYKHTSENDYFVARTSNQGSSYSISSLGITNTNLSKYSRLQSYDGTNIFLTRGNHSIKSNNNGLDWISQSLTTPLSYAYDIYFVDANNGFAVFDSPNNNHRGIYKTTNGGSSWSQTGQTVTTAHLLAATSSKAFAIQFGGTQLWASADGFSTKNTTDFGGAVLQDLQIFSGTAYFSGSNGLLGKVSATNLSNVSTYVAKTDETFTAVSKAGTSIILGSSSGKMYLVTSFNELATELNAYSSTNKIYDLCARDENEFLTVGLGSDTKISFDQGASWDKLLAEQYDSILFSSCYWKNDGTVILGAGNELMLVTKHGEGVESLRIAKDEIADNDLESGFNSDHLIEDTIGNDKFSNNSINDSKILTGSLIESKIDDNAVGSSELNAMAIITRTIQDEAITHEKIGSDIDASSKIGDDVLTGGDFSDLGGIDYALIQSDTIDSRLFSETTANQLTDGDLNTAAIQTQHLDHFTFNGQLIKNNELTSDKISDSSISAFNIQSGALTSNKIEADTFDTRQIASFAISNSQVANGSIVTLTLADKEYWSDAIKNAELNENSLKDDSFEAKQFRSRVFNNNLIQDNSVDFNNLVSETIRADQIKDNSIDAIDFKTNSITSDKLETGAIDTSLIATNSVKGEFILDGDIESSKIHSEAISGVLLIKHTIESDRLQTNTFKDVDLAKNEVTKSKIHSRTLSNSHFENLAKANFATGSFSTKGGRLYQSDSNSIYVQGVNTAQKTLATHGRGSQLSYARISPDGSKVAFISGGKIYWADRTFDRVRATNLNYDGTSDQFLIWSNDNRVIYHFDDSNDQIFAYNIITKSNTEGPTVSGGGGSKLVFNPDDPSEWARLNANGSLDTSDGNCAASGTTFTELEISQTDAVLFVAKNNSNELGACSYGASFSYSSVLSTDPKYIKAHPLRSDRLFYFQGDDLYQIEVPFNNARNLLTASMTNNDDKLRSWIFSGHVLEDDAIENDNLANSILTSSHLADLSIVSDSFNGAVIVSDHIQTDAVESSHIAATTLDQSVFASAVISAGNLEDGTLEGKYFTESSISKSRILSGDIRASKIDDDSIGNSELEVNIISQSKVSSKSILTTHMISEIVSSSSMIADSIIDASFIKTKEVSSFHVVNSAINSIKISSEQIYPRVLNSEAITKSKLIINSLLGTDFDSDVVTVAKIETNAFDKGDGFIVTIENGVVKRYDWDGSNTETINNTKTWSKLQNTAHGNRLSVFADDQSYEMSFISGAIRNPEYRPVSARSVLSTTDNQDFVIGGNSWIELDNPGSSFAKGAYAVANSKLYLFGGDNGSLQSNVQEYEPSSRTWSSKTSMSGGARSNMAAVELDGLIYVIGGKNDDGALSRVEVYDPVADSWSNASDLPSSLYDISAVAINERVYVFGGNTGSGDEAFTYEYNPGSDAWATMADMNGDRSATAAAVYNNKAYVFGGNGPNTKVEEYDPSNNNWSDKEAMPIARAGASAVTLGDQIYVAAGSGNSGELNILKKYNPTDNTWSGALDNLASSVSNAAIAAIDGLIYFVGGTSNGSAKDQMQVYFKGEADHLWIYQDGAPNTRIDTGVIVSAGMDYSPQINKLAYIAQLNSDNLIRIYDGTSASTEQNLGNNSISKPVFNKDGTKLFFIQGNTIQKRVLGDSTTQLVDIGVAITDLKVSIETDKVYYVSDGNLYSYDDSSNLLIDAPDNITEFEVIPYSMFDEDQIDDRLASGVFDSKHIASRLFDDTSFTAGTLDEDELANSVITGAILTNNAITADKYAGTVAGTKIASQAITSSIIVNESITTAKILDGGLKSINIMSGTLQANRLSGNIDGDKIENLTLTGLKFIENSIEEAKIQTASITQAKLKDTQISSANIANLTLQTTDFKTAEVNASVIADRILTDGNIQTNQIESSKIKANTLTDSVFDSAAVTYGHIKTLQIDNSKLANTTLQDDNFYFSSIDGTKLADNTLSEAMLSNKGIHGDDFESSIANDKVKAESLKGEDFITETIDVSKFKTKTVTGGAFGDGILSASQIADNALTDGNIADNTIDGSQLANNAVTSTKLAADTFNSSNFDNVFDDINISSLTLSNSDFSTEASKKLTSADFETIFADTRTVQNSSIQTAELIEDVLVKSSGDDGLRIDNNNIIQALLEDNSLIGNRFAEQAITKEDVSDNSLSISKIKSFVLTESRLDGAAVAEADLSTAAIIQLNIADKAVGEAKLTDNSFDEDDIYQIGGDEIQNLTGEKLKTDSIGSGLLSNLTSREIGLLETADLVNLTFDKNYFKDDGISTDSLDSSSKLTQGKFKNQIPSSKIKNNDIPYAKLNVGDNTTLAKIFGGDEANSEHRHDALSQILTGCSTNYILIGGDSQEAFCMSTPASNSTTIGAHKDEAHSIEIEGNNIRGKVCTIQQLIRAVEDGKNLNTALTSSSFTMESNGFGGKLKLLTRSNLGADGNGGLALSDVSSTQNYEMRYCY